jgi:hypothetical protein
MRDPNTGSLKRSAFNLRHQRKAERLQRLSGALRFAKIYASGFSRNALISRGRCAVVRPRQVDVVRRGNLLPPAPRAHANREVNCLLKVGRGVSFLRGITLRLAEGWSVHLVGFVFTKVPNQSIGTLQIKLMFTLKFISV